MERWTAGKRVEESSTVEPAQVGMVGSRQTFPLIEDFHLGEQEHRGISPTAFQKVPTESGIPT